MKKILVFLLILFAGCTCFVGTNFLHAKANELTSKQYLVEADYLQNAQTYSILSEEIKSTSTPFDFSTKSMMAGQSISPVVSNQTTKEFSKTITTNTVAVDSAKSLFLYLFFSETLANNLTITISDDNSNSATWNLSKQMLMEQILHNYTTSKLRFGWIKVELPVIEAEMIGTLSSITKLIINYFADNTTSQSAYAQVSLYAPYISNATNTEIAFTDKQNFYNFSLNFGENFNNNQYCVGDYYTVTSWKNLFEYCILGDVDCLKYTINKYVFKLQIIDNASTDMEATLLDSGEFSIGLITEGLYTFRVTLYDSEDNWLWQAPDKQTYVNEFVAVYLKNQLPDMKAKTKSNFDIYIGNMVTQSNSLIATSSDTGVAEVSIEDNKLIVNAKKAGKATIKLSVMASRAAAEEQLYEYEYTITVTKNTTTSWVAIIFGAIGLLIASVIVYIIMVKRRLIIGKYPKY